MRRLLTVAVLFCIAGCGHGESRVDRARADVFAAGKTINRLCHTPGADIRRLTAAVRTVDRLQVAWPNDARVQNVSGAALLIASDDCPTVGR